MVLIRLGEPSPVLPARRIPLGPVAMLALQAALADDGASLPQELQVEVSPTGAALAGVDVDAELAAAAEALREHGVLDGDAPVEAVRANLAALARSPRRIRTSLAGPEARLLAHHWAGPQLGGSLVRDAERHVLSLFDVRSLGDEVLALLPVVSEPDHDLGGDLGRRQRAAFTVPLEALAAVAAADDIPEAVAPAMGEFLGLDGDRVAGVREWTQGVRAVLHVTVSAPEPDALPGMLIWFLAVDGWWSARTDAPSTSPRTATLTPVRREDLPAALGSLIAQGWV